MEPLQSTKQMGMWFSNSEAHLTTTSASYKTDIREFRRDADSGMLANIKFNLNIKYLLFYILSLLSYMDSKGSTHGIMVGSIENVYYEGVFAGETQYQNQAIAFLCNEYMKKYYPSIKEKVFLELEFEEKFNNKISYDKFKGEEWKYSEKNRPVKGIGIRIRMSRKYNRAESALKLLDYGLNHLSELKKASNDYFNMNEDNRPDDLTINPSILLKIIESTANQNIKDVLNIKVFRNLGSISEDLYKEYYFKNDKYYFIDFLNNDSVYLELTQVYQIINVYYLGTLIFDTDSTGYFYNINTKKLSTKFEVKDKKESFYYTKTAFDNIKNRIYFEYDSYKEDKKKFIYLTDKLFLIQKVEILEDEMIRKVME